MNFNEYQAKSKKTIQQYNADKTANIVITYLGLIGEAGSVVSELKKKLRDGDSYSNFKNKLKEELGDVLWYIAAIASQNNLSLDEIANENIVKTLDRFSDEVNGNFTDYDEGYPDNEKLPDEFEIHFIPYEKLMKMKTELALKLLKN